jgi:hypothetical protein
MGIRDVIKKKDKFDEDEGAGQQLAVPGEFRFVRTDTYTEEVIQPPGEPYAQNANNYDNHLSAREGGRSHLGLDVFRSSRGRSRSASASSSRSAEKESAGKRLSRRLHLSRSPSVSENVPQDLPEIVTVTPDGREDEEGTESQWETRATILALENEKHRSRTTSPVRSPGGAFTQMTDIGGSTSPGSGAGGLKEIDDDIQEAIRLHEAGDLEKSTMMFGRLADPNGANNPLSQVLYGLALR